MNNRVREAIRNIYPFSDEELAVIQALAKPVSLSKGKDLLEEGTKCNTIYLVESGSLRSYYNNDGVDVTLSFTFEDQFTTSFTAYVNREDSKLTIQAMEETVVWALHNRSYPKQEDAQNGYSTFIRRLAIRILSATEEHYLMMRINAPAGRYAYILKNKPELLQRVPLGFLASYIGITRETLSRIRSNKY